MKRPGYGRPKKVWNRNGWKWKRSRKGSQVRSQELVTLKKRFVGDGGPARCPALQTAGSQGRTFCWTQPYLRRQLVYIPADIRARACLPGAGSEGGRHSPERFRFLSLFSLWSWVKSCPHISIMGKLAKTLSSRLASSPSLTSPTHIDHLHVGCPCHPAAHRRRDAMPQIDDSRGKLGGAAPRPSSAGPNVRILSHPHPLTESCRHRLGARARTADCRLLDMQSAFASCSRRAPAPQRSPCPKGHILPSDAMITNRGPRGDETARSTQARLKPRLATVPSLQHVSTIPFPGPEQLGSAA